MRGPAGTAGTPAGGGVQQITREGDERRKAVMTIDGATDADVFRTSVKRVLGPTLAPGDRVLMENLRAHTAIGVRQTIARRGARLRSMPPCSPDLSLIEPYWSQVKMAPREAQVRLREAPDLAIADALATATEAKAHGWLRHGGYAVQSLANRYRLARRLTTILPSMTLAEALETTRIHRVASLTDDRLALVTTRPFRAPPHPITEVGVTVGGQVPMPGAGSRAHHGDLCLDELPAFRRHVLEVLQQPLEEGVTNSPPPGHHGSGPVGRAGGSAAIQEDVRVGVIA